MCTMTIEPMLAEMVSTQASRSRIRRSWRERRRRRMRWRIRGNFTRLVRQRFRQRRHHRHLQRQRNDQVQRRIDQAGAAPAEILRQKRAERPAHRRGKAAEQRQIGDRRPRVPAVELAERGEHRVVEPGAHAAAEHDPAEQIHRQIWRKPDAQKPRGIHQRRGGEHRPAAVPVDDRADLWRDQARDQQPDRGAADHPSRATSRCRRQSAARAPRENRTTCPSRGSGRCRAR